MATAAKNTMKLGTRFAILSVATIVAVAAVVAVFQNITRSADLRKGIEKTISLQVGQLSTLLASSVEKFDEAALEEILLGQFAIPALKAIEVEDGKGNQIAGKIRDGKGAPAVWGSGIDKGKALSKEGPVTHNGVALGKIRLYYDLSLIHI